MLDFEDLISHDGLDIVSVATPDFAHTPVILAALAADKHVLTEKPLATTLNEANVVAAAAAKSKGKLMIDFHNRVNPAVVQLRDAVASGESVGRSTAPRA